MKKRTIIACALSLLFPAVGLQAETEAPEGKDGKLPRVFNYNRNAQLFRVDPHVSVPEEKDRHMKKYEQTPDREPFKLNAAGTLPSAPQLQSQQQPNQDQAPKKSKNWLTPSDWSSPKDYAPEGSDSLLPSPEEELEAIRQLFSSDKSDPSNSEEEDSFLSYIQHRQQLEEQENEVMEGEKDYHDGSDLFSREQKSAITFRPSVALLSEVDSEKNAEEFAAEERTFKPAVEMLNFWGEQDNDLELEEDAKPLKALAGLSSRESAMEGSPAMKTQALLNDITSKWLNKEPSNAGLPTMKDQFNAPRATLKDDLLNRTAVIQPLRMNSSPVSLPRITPESRFSKNATRPSLSPSAQLDPASFAPSRPSLKNPSGLGASNYGYKPQRVVATTRQGTRSSFPKSPNTSSRTIKPAQISSGLNNSLPGMSGFSDPMGK